MKNEDINYRKPNNNIVLPIDTSARDFAFEADRKETRRQREEKDRMMDQPIDTSARDFALKSELEKGLRELEKQQAMYQDIEEPHKHR